MILDIIILLILGTTFPSTSAMSSTSSMVREQAVMGSNAAPIGYRSSLVSYTGSSNVQARAASNNDEPGFWDDPYGNNPQPDDDEPDFWDDPFMDNEPSTPIGDVPWVVMSLCAIGYAFYQRKKKSTNQSTNQ